MRVIAPPSGAITNGFTISPTSSPAIPIAKPIGQIVAAPSSSCRRSIRPRPYGRLLSGTSAPPQPVRRCAARRPGSGGDLDCRLGRAALPDQPLELVDVDRRDGQQGGLAPLVSERDQPLAPPAQHTQVVFEPTPLAVEDVELVHELSPLGRGGLSASPARRSSPPPQRDSRRRPPARSRHALPGCAAHRRLERPAASRRSRAARAGTSRCLMPRPVSLPCREASRAVLSVTCVATQSSRGRIRCSLRSWTSPRT